MYKELEYACVHKPEDKHYGEKFPVIPAGCKANRTNDGDDPDHWNAQAPQVAIQSVQRGIPRDLPDGVSEDVAHVCLACGFNLHNKIIFQENSQKETAQPTG